MPRAKLRTPELRDHVLRTAAAVIAADGVGGLTTRRVAQAADTSTPAVYELFGDKAGLVRELFFEGFRRLRDQFDQLDPSDDPLADLAALAQRFRAFSLANPALAQVMFARPFPDFDPGPDEEQAGRAVRRIIVSRVRRAIDAGLVAGDPDDIALVLVSLSQGLASNEAAGWLGSSQASIDRRWTVAIDAVLRGLRPMPTA